jgi:uncharacterized protein
VSHRSSVKTVFRLDRGTLRKPERTPQGFLRVDGIASRTGVFEYTNPDGSIRRELRLDEEVFAPKALAGFEGAPLTDGHPPVMVTADNVRSYEVGTVTSPARRDGGFVVTSIVIKDPKVIRKVERGDTGLSVGYSVDLDETPGVHPKFGRYDAVQRNLVINHLAVAVTPRAGEAARIRMDAADIAIEIDRSKSDRETGVKMADPDNMTPEQQVAALKLQLEQAENLARERKDALDAVLTEREADKGRLATLNERLAALETQMSAGHAALETEAIQKATDRADAAELELQKLKDSREADIRKAADIRLKAQAIMGSDFRVDGRSDRELQAIVIKRFAPKEDTGESVSAAYIASRFDSLVDAHLQNARSLTRASEVLAAGKREQRVDSREARARAWREQALNPQGYRATFGPNEEA